MSAISSVGPVVVKNPTEASLVQEKGLPLAQQAITEANFHPFTSASKRYPLKPIPEETGNKTGKTRSQVQESSKTSQRLPCALKTLGISADSSQKRKEKIENFTKELIETTIPLERSHLSLSYRADNRAISQLAEALPQLFQQNTALVKFVSQDCWVIFLSQLAVFSYRTSGFFIASLEFATENNLLSKESLVKTAEKILEKQQDFPVALECLQKSFEAILKNFPDSSKEKKTTEKLLQNHLKKLEKQKSLNTQSHLRSGFFKSLFKS